MKLSRRKRLIAQWLIGGIAVCTGAICWSFFNASNGAMTVLPGDEVEGLTSVLERAPETNKSPIRFRDITEKANIQFTHFQSQRTSLLPEDMGSGVVCGDFNNDGRPDLLFVNFSGSLSAPNPAASCKLYRNLGDMRFEDVTQASGLDKALYGLGGAWGDYDSDGDLDLYITVFGDNVLYENLGDGRFRDITKHAGVGDSGFGTGCAWADYDRDGHLDLYVANYVKFIHDPSLGQRTNLQNAAEVPFTLNPSSYKPQANMLYRNRGDGTFEEVAQKAGVDDPEGRGLSAAWVDFNNDLWPDLYIANDISKNGIFLNNGDGSFSDIGGPSLAADYRGAMGIAIADLEGDGDSDMLITHWLAQENALYVNMFIDELVDPTPGRAPFFLDSADRFGLGHSSLGEIGWATGFCDFDNDTRLDLWVINGSTFEQKANHALLRPQAPFLFRHGEDGRYDNVVGAASQQLAKAFVGRGGAQADFDGDGRVDLALMVHAGKAILYKNESETSSHWLRLDLRQTKSNTQALGARVAVVCGQNVQTATVGVSPSYLSQNEHVLHFGLGQAEKVDELIIYWPDGSEQVQTNVPADQVLTYLHTPKKPRP